MMDEGAVGGMQTICLVFRPPILPLYTIHAAPLSIALDRLRLGPRQGNIAMVGADGLPFSRQRSLVCRY